MNGVLACHFIHNAFQIGVLVPIIYALSIDPQTTEAFLLFLDAGLWDECAGGDLLLINRRLINSLRLHCIELVQAFTFFRFFIHLLNLHSILLISKLWSIPMGLRVFQFIFLIFNLWILHHLPNRITMSHIEHAVGEFRRLLSNKRLNFDIVINKVNLT